MSSFVNLRTFFNDPEERNVTYLADIYSNRDLLRNAIVELTKESLNAESIFNKSILIKPNWVNHPRNPYDDICLVSNHNLIVALVEVILPLKPLNITIGDAPIQGCDWPRMISPKFIKEISALSFIHDVPISIQDFRRVVFDTNKNLLSVERNPISEYLIFDVGKRSFLESVTPHGKKPFRVSHYDYEKLANLHHAGVHKYCITKAFFEADLVVSIPKVKTHEKTGLTGALKNLVGINGDKDYLPHHRKGGTSCGGDCYPGFSILRNISENLFDVMNKRTGKRSFRYWQKIAIESWKLSKPRKVDQFGAGWHGNDTTWRMVLDLNLISIFGQPDGHLSKFPQRQLFSLCDGIIGGQGDGPLFPKPLPLGFLSFSNNAAINDYIFALLMELKPEKVPLINNAFSLYEKEMSNIQLNGSKISKDSLEEFSIRTLPPAGWEEYFYADI